MTMRMTAVLVLAIAAATAAADEAKIEAKVYGPYFEKNTSGLKGDSSYLLVSEQKTFDAYFGAGFTMKQKPVLIPKDTFDKHLVVAVIKRGKSITTYEIDKAELKDGTLTLSYKTTEKGGGGDAKFASPLVVTVPKEGVKSVVFMENGKKAETVKVK